MCGNWRSIPCEMGSHVSAGNMSMYGFITLSSHS